MIRLITLKKQKIGSKVIRTMKQYNYLMILIKVIAPFFVKDMAFSTINYIDQIVKFNSNAKYILAFRNPLDTIVSFCNKFT